MLSRISNSQAPLLDSGVICAATALVTFVGVVATHALHHLAVTAGQFTTAQAAVIVAGTPLFLGSAKVALIAAGVFIALHFLKEGVRALARLKSS